MSNIEEDIKILESMLEEYYSCSVPGMNMHIDIFFSLEQAEAIEHILEEREQDKKKIKKLEEEIENKENKIWQLKETVQDLENECISLHELIDEEM